MMKKFIEWLERYFMADISEYEECPYCTNVEFVSFCCHCSGSGYVRIANQEEIENDTTHD
jgi:putative N-acetylmannosamine-6-phosphate epimerase